MCVCDRERDADVFNKLTNWSFHFISCSINDAAAEVRTVAAMWLGEVGHPPDSENQVDEASVGACIVALEDSSVDVRRHAGVFAFSFFGDVYN